MSLIARMSKRNKVFAASVAFVLAGVCALEVGRSSSELYARRSPRAPRKPPLWLQVREYISTTTKNGIATLIALRDAVTGNAWLPT